ncbi:MAG: ferritin [Desulfobacteraceae bacterium]
MLSPKMQTTLNNQINAELYSSYLYLAMSAYFQSINLAGFAQWMKVQAYEELMHAMKFYDHVNERGGRVLLEPIESPPSHWDSPLATFEAVFEHEQKVTGLIHNLVDLAVEERDHATNIFLQWFVTEQVEEEASAHELVQKLKLAGNSPQALFMLDRQLGARTFLPPATAAQT